MTRTESSVRVVFSDIAKTETMDFECALDIDDFGTLVSVEIIGLREQVGIVEIEQYKQFDDMHWSYDDEVDAFYLRLASTRYPIRTKTSVGTLSLDENRRLAAFDVLLPTTVIEDPTVTT
ncbi:MAG: hypothetical protein ABSB96_01900 [Gaiellaceae bacterium]